MNVKCVTHNGDNYIRIIDLINWMSFTIKDADERDKKLIFAMIQDIKSMKEK